MIGRQSFRAQITMPRIMHEYLERRAQHMFKSVSSIVRGYIEADKEYLSFLKNSTTGSEPAKSVDRPHVLDLELDDERRPQLGETLVAYRARLAKSGLVEPRFDTDPPWVD